MAQAAMKALDFDVAVIGAGPAGAVFAYQAARRGLSVVLTERFKFPRSKVCGCCLSNKTIELLTLAGLERIPEQLQAKTLDELVIFSRHSANLALPLKNWKAVSRKSFDLALAQHAQAAGAEFLSGSQATIKNSAEHCVEIEIKDAEGNARLVRASLAVVADGIAGSALKGYPEMTPVMMHNSRLGTGAVSHAARTQIESGKVHMLCGAEGYLGMVRLEDDTVDIAAALDPDFLHASSTPAIAAQRMLVQCRLPVPDDLQQIQWKGTVPLTRRRRAVAAQRIFVIGDAAGFVEPFTGEGIAWALASAQAALPLVLKAVRKWDDSFIWRWSHIHRRQIIRQQFTTKLLAKLLRHEHIFGFAQNILTGVPRRLQNLLLDHLTRPLSREEIEWLQI